MNPLKLSAEHIVVAVVYGLTTKGRKATWSYIVQPDGLYSVRDEQKKASKSFSLHTKFSFKMLRSGKVLSFTPSFHFFVLLKLLLLPKYFLIHVMKIRKCS